MVPYFFNILFPSSALITENKNIIPYLTAVVDKSGSIPLHGRINDIHIIDPEHVTSNTLQGINKNILCISYIVVHTFMVSFLVDEMPFVGRKKSEKTKIGGKYKKIKGKP